MSIRRAIREFLSCSAAIALFISHLWAASGVRFDIVDALSQRPLDGVSIRMERLPAGHVHNTVVTDSRSLVLARPGLYRVEASHPEYMISRRYVRVSDAGNVVWMGLVRKPPDIIHIPEDADSVIPAGELRGSIAGVSDTGRLRVRLYPLSGGESSSILDAMVESNGKFDLHGVEMGLHVLVVLENSNPESGGYQVLHTRVVMLRSYADTIRGIDVSINLTDR